MTTGTTRRAKLQSNRDHHQTNAQLIAGRMAFLSPNQRRYKALKGIDEITNLHNSAGLPRWAAREML